MNKKQVKELFNKYSRGQCTEQEKELLTLYLESFQNKTLEDFDYAETKEKMWTNIELKTTRSFLVRKRNFQKYLKYAAVIVVAISASSLWFVNKKHKKESLLTITEEPIILTTADNEKIIIDVNSPLELKNQGKLVSNQKGASIHYNKNKNVNELIYNKIEIPNGRTFKLILSDGTKVHLNAGSSLKYPVAFLKDHKREIYLKGEAYFEVAKDLKHPFIVNTELIGVRVIGTHFNVNTYNPKHIHTVLAEGSVAVYKQVDRDKLKKHTTIIPGEKAFLHKQTLGTKKININEYLSWREGQIIFNNDLFTNIIEKIERKYNVTILNNYTKLNKLRYKGTFKNETIIDLMDTFKESAGFDYAIKNNQIIINKPK